MTKGTALCDKCYYCVLRRAGGAVTHALLARGVPQGTAQKVVYSVHREHVSEKVTRQVAVLVRLT